MINMATKAILNNKFLYYYMDANIKTIASFYRGSGIKRDQISQIGFPCVRYGEIYTTYNY